MNQSLTSASLFANSICGLQAISLQAFLFRPVRESQKIKDTELTITLNEEKRQLRIGPMNA